MTKPHILVINPNTSEEITASVERLAMDEARGDATIEAVTAPFGARYISSRVSFTIAGHAVLDAYAGALVGAARRPDAAIVGCFGDPGIDGLREVAGVPVLGFAESGMLAAAAEPGSFVVATIGTTWRPILEELARRSGLADRLAGLIFIDQWVRDTTVAAAEIERAARQLGAARVVIGGTGLIPRLPKLAEGIGLPVIDPHRTTIRKAIRRVAEAGPEVATAAPAGQFRGLSPQLQRMLGETRTADVHG